MHVIDWYDINLFIRNRSLPPYFTENFLKSSAPDEGLMSALSDEATSGAAHGFMLLTLMR